MEKFEVGELVRDILNQGGGAYGLGIIMRNTPPFSYDPNSHIYDADQDRPGLRYDVYFTKFEKVITFHEDYLEKV